MIRKCVAFLRELNSAQTSRCGYTFGTDVVLDALEKRVAHKFCPWLRFGLHKFEMGDSTTEARGRSWRLVLAPWFEEQRAALRSFGNDESNPIGAVNHRTCSNTGCVSHVRPACHMRHDIPYPLLAEMVYFL